MSRVTPQVIWTVIRRARLLRVLMIYLGACLATLEAVDLIAAHVGLPDWTFRVAIVLLLLGFPIIVTTALVQSAPRASAGAAEEAPAAEEPPTSVSEGAVRAGQWLTWPRAITGGVLAFALLGVTVTVLTLARMLGIGPAGSLVAAGVLGPRERIILADFENLTRDSLLAIVVAEALRIDLAESPMVTVAAPEYVAKVLTRMAVEPGTPLDLGLAREVAIREGLRAVVVGEVGALGNRYMLTAEIVAAESGEVLAGFRETAGGEDDIVVAVDRLSHKLRERIGESLKSIRRSPPLNDVTTGSLEALRKYSQALGAIYTDGEAERGIALLEEALALDTSFAVAYSELGTTLLNRGEQRARALEALGDAYEHRDRLTERERQVVTGNYHLDVTREWDKAIAAYRTVLDIYSDDAESLNNLAYLYLQLRDFTRAEELIQRALAVDSTDAVIFGNLVYAQVALGKFEEAERSLERMREKTPGHPQTAWRTAALASARGDYRAAEAHVRGLWEAGKGSLAQQARASLNLAVLARVRGRPAEAERHLRDAMAAQRERGLGSEYLEAAIELAWLDVWYRGAPARGLRQAEEALALYPLDSLDPLDRPYLSLAKLYAVAGRPRRAAQLVREYEARLDVESRRGSEEAWHEARGAVALAEGRVEDAIAELAAWDAATGCPVCALPDLASAYERAGVADSLVPIYERYLSTPWLPRLLSDSYYLGQIHERLGQLYREQGDADRAIEQYGKLIDLWRDADPEFEPRVEAARRAILAFPGHR